MKVIIYGLGNKTKIIGSKLKKDHSIIGYTDNKSNIESYNNTKFYKLEELKSIEYDYIILAIDNAKASKVVKKYLSVKYNIDLNKIVDFYHLYNEGVSTQKVDRVMQNPDNKDGYDGIIIGASHSGLGINPKGLKGEFCNLSVSSQDFYYTLKTLQYCFENYKDKINKLKYVVVDLVDYIYFNYDVSLTSNMIKYLSWGGYNLDFHHYEQNRSYTLSVEEELAKINCKITKPLSLEERNVRDLLFNDLYGCNKDKMFRDFATPDQRNNKIEEGLSDYEMPKFGIKRYEKTIEENKVYLDEIFKTIYKMNPNMKIYAILIPRYEAVENDYKPKYAHWEKEFEEIIKDFKLKYNFEYLNFKECKEISSHNEYYQDSAHLNYDGATAFTKLLNSYID